MGERIIRRLVGRACFPKKAKPDPTSHHPLHPPSELGYGTGARVFRFRMTVLRGTEVVEVWQI